MHEYDYMTTDKTMLFYCICLTFKGSDKHALLMQLEGSLFPHVYTSLKNNLVKTHLHILCGGQNAEMLNRSRQSLNEAGETTL